MSREKESFRKITKKHIEEECKRLREDKILSKFYMIRPKKVVRHGKVYWEVELVRRKHSSTK